jgi:hypothetical protein
MKKLLLTISFMTLLSSTLMAKTETITEEVCNAPAGCRIEMTTGVCIGCVTITRTIVTKDPISVVERPTIKSKTSLVVSVDKSGWATARCRSGCPSSRAATMGYKFEGKFWKKKKSHRG